MVTRERWLLFAWFYALMVWHFSVASATAFVASIWLTVQLDPAGAFMIPLAGFFALVGHWSLVVFRKVLATPHW